MENHPIPQDVTGFQFKLIGDMTVKQFAYLAVGVIFGWIFFSLPLHFLFRFPLALLCIGGGVSFAFLPLEGRPLDTMVINFIKAIFAPNLFVYQKVGGDLALLVQVKPSQVATQPQEPNTVKLQQYLQSIPQKPKNKLDEKEMVFFQSLSSLTTPPVGSTPLSSAPNPSLQQIVVHATQQAVGTVLHPLPSNDEVPLPEKVADTSSPQAQAAQGQGLPHIVVAADSVSPIEIKLKEAANQLEQQLEQAKIQEQQQKELGHGTEAHHNVEVLQDQLNQIVAQKQALEKQLLDLSKKFQEKQAPPTNVYKPVDAEVKEQTVHVRKIPKGMGAAVGLPITPEFPNLLVGIVKDPRGNILSNILVEVRDTQGNPVRAFKTNTLGQFASATPLLNGTYTLVFEDPQGKQKFDAVEITADGSIISPLEVISTDAREELRKELFG